MKRRGHNQQKLEVCAKIFNLKNFLAHSPIYFSQLSFHIYFAKNNFWSVLLVRVKLKKLNLMESTYS